MSKSRSRRPADRLKFKLDPAVSALVVSELLDTLSNGNSDVRAAIAAELDERDIRREFAATLDPLGLHDDNVVDAFTGFWLVMWSIMEKAPLPTRDQAAGVRRQIQSIVRSHPVTRLPAQRQMVGEAMQYEAMLAYGAYRQAELEADQDRLSAMAITARQNMVRRGFDPKRIKIPRAAAKLH